MATRIGLTLTKMYTVTNYVPVLPVSALAVIVDSSCDLGAPADRGECEVTNQYNKLLLYYTRGGKA